MLSWLRAWWRDESPLGARGERAAERFLRRKGYRILDRNLHVGKDEADLTALAPDGRTLVIVEVKTRMADDILPEEQVGPAKQRHMVRLAARLAQQDRFRDCAVRFDVIAVVWPADAKRPTIRHHEGAFLSTL